MPDGDYSDYGTRLARVEQRVSDLDQRVTTFAEVTPNVIRLTEQVTVLRRDLKEYAAKVGKLSDEIADRERDREENERETRKERRQARFAMYGLTVSIFSALLLAGVTILTTAIH